MARSNGGHWSDGNAVDGRLLLKHDAIIDWRISPVRTPFQWQHPCHDIGMSARA